MARLKWQKKLQNSKLLNFYQHNYYTVEGKKTVSRVAQLRLCYYACVNEIRHVTAIIKLRVVVT